MVQLLLWRTLAVRYVRPYSCDVAHLCDIKSYILVVSALQIVCIPLFWQLLTYGRRIPIPELFARIDAVDASTVKRVANRFIFDQVLFCQPTAFQSVEFSALLCVDLIASMAVSMLRALVKVLKTGPIFSRLL